MLPAILRAAAVILSGLWAGVLFGDWRGATLVRPTLPDACFVQFQQGLHTSFVPMMPILLISSAVLSAIAAWGLRGMNRTSTAMFGAAVLGLVSVAVITVAVNVPINDTMMTWDASNPPAGMRQTWLSWERSHSVRTLIAVAAFGLQCVALTVLPYSSEARKVSRRVA